MRSDTVSPGWFCRQRTPQQAADRRPEGRRPIQESFAKTCLATPSLPFVPSHAYREAVQVNETLVTVVDREEPRASGPGWHADGTVEHGSSLPGCWQAPGRGPRLGSRAAGGRRGAMRAGATPLVLGGVAEDPPCRAGGTHGSALRQRVRSRIPIVGGVLTTGLRVPTECLMLGGDGRRSVRGRAVVAGAIKALGNWAFNPGQSA
jgi:hypothetical protein